MNAHDDDQDIAERLHRLAHGVEPVHPDPAADVRRGRARLRRRQALSVVGSSAGVLAVVLGIAALVNSGGRSPLTAADGSEGPTVLASQSTPSSTPGPARACSSTTPDMPSALKALGDNPLKNPTIRSVLTSYATVLARHLDPAGHHLQRVPTGFTGNPDLPCDPTAPVELGTKLSWTVPGKPGESMVFVSVTNDWANDQIYLAFDHWSPAPPPDQVVHAWQAMNSTGGTGVAIERADGTVVAIQVDLVFGNNAQVGAPNFGLSTTQLLYAAADPAFTLPR